VLADGAKFGKHCRQSLFSKKLAHFFDNPFCAGISPFFEIPVVSIDKQSILDYLSNEYSNLE